MEIKLKQVLQELQERFFGTIDLMFKSINTPVMEASMVFIDGMIDSKQLELSILQPLIERREPFTPDIHSLFGILTASNKVTETESLDEVVAKISAGDAALFIEGAQKIFLFAVRKANARAIDEPPTGAVLKGPREGFVEDIKNNMVLLRRKIRSPKLVFHSFTVGRITETTVLVAFIEGVTKADIVDKVEECINAIDIDGVFDSSAISKFLEAKPYSMFKQVGNSEKPDVIAAKMLNGRVAILVDGSPIVLTVPFIFVEDFEDVQDSYKRPSRVTFLRWVRWLGIFLAVLAPAVFVAVQEHQYQILPLELLKTILTSSQGTPFSPAVEMLLALLIFEILSEASIRMPRYIGMALSVVGAIVLGETAVKAGFLADLTVLCIALSGIGIYAVPDEVGTLSLLRFLFVVAAATFGVFGILVVCLVLFAYLLSYEGYGVAYLAPLSPIYGRELRDAIFKMNATEMKTRPGMLRLENKTRLRYREKENE